MLMGCAWTELRVKGLMDLKQSLGIDESLLNGHGRIWALLI